MIDTASILFGNDRGNATLEYGDDRFSCRGRWILGTPWERFGQYDSYVVLREDGRIKQISAHAGELVPGSTEDLVAHIRANRGRTECPSAPMTLELDPTYACMSKNCGGRCFSAPYRQAAPNASIPTLLCRQVLEGFSKEGGRIVRFDGGGDPLCHPDVRNGVLPRVAHRLGLKSTLLTSGDMLPGTDLQALGESRCYLRLSLNAATQETRARFHGNQVKLADIVKAAEEFASWINLNRVDLPIGCTFLLDTANAHEVVDCARMVKSAGISHLSVRRVLGPQTLRPEFDQEQKEALLGYFEEVERLASESFRVFLPWRDPNEMDLNPSRGDFEARRCWQATFKTVIEPDLEHPGMRGQLCGRYRGCGVGQENTMNALFSETKGDTWIDHWRKSFDEYPVSRRELPRRCVSCIDRGFIVMMDELMDFLGDNTHDFAIFHLKTDKINPRPVAGTQ